MDDFWKDIKWIESHREAAQAVARLSVDLEFLRKHEDERIITNAQIRSTETALRKARDLEAAVRARNPDAVAKLKREITDIGASVMDQLKAQQQEQEQEGEQEDAED